CAPNRAMHQMNHIFYRSEDYSFGTSKGTATVCEDSWNHLLISFNMLFSRAVPDNDMLSPVLCSFFWEHFQHIIYKLLFILNSLTYFSSHLHQLLSNGRFSAFPSPDTERFTN